MQGGPRKRTKNRMIFLIVVIFLCGFVPLGIKLFNIQVIDYEYYQQKALSQQTSDKIISPLRGTIYDRNLKPLAQSATVETVFISPLAIIKNKEDPETIARGLSEALEVDYEKILAMTEKKGSEYEIVKKGVEKPEADLVREFITEGNYKSISLEAGTKRYYPYGNFASHIIGFVGTDSQGLLGIEAMYDEKLSGTPGRAISMRNPTGSAVQQYERFVEPQNGYGVVLTIDEVMQHFLEKYLEEAKIEHQLQQKAMGILMNPNTGEILAMSVKDDFDPNEPFALTEEIQAQMDAAESSEESAAIRKNYLESYVWRNNVISDTYEPGSVFKIITAAMALEEKVTSPTDQFYCGGHLKVGKWTIGCHRRAGHGSETFFDGIKNSCNPVFMTVAARMGRDAFYKYQAAFGFHEKTKINLPGEGSSIVHSLEGLNEAELATSSFGQTFRVTPIQMLTAVSAVANGGTLYQPYIVKELIDDNNAVVESFSPYAKRQVISEETSKLMRESLEEVVTSGTGKNAYIKGFHVAGKTGTSEKIDVKDEFGNADSTKRIASFCAFAPANDPQLVVLIILDEPLDYSQGGGALAAPVARNVLEDCLKYLEVKPRYTAEEMKTLDITIPQIVDLNVQEAEQAISSSGLTIKVLGEGERVVRQLPAFGTSIPAGTTVFAITEENYQKTTAAVPDLIGKTAEQANRLIADAGFNVRITGATGRSGVIVKSQYPYAGEIKNIGEVITIEMHDIVNVEGAVSVQR